jgi:hypothetical protein
MLLYYIFEAINGWLKELEDVRTVLFSLVMSHIKTIHDEGPFYKRCRSASFITEDVLNANVEAVW